MALAVGVSGVECVVGVSRICTRSGEGVVGSGLLVAWAVTLGFNFVGNGLRISFWGSSIALLSQQWGDCFIMLLTMLVHYGVNQALFL